MTFYRILFAWDVLVVLVLAYFCAEGLRYGDTGATLAMWLPILAAPIATLVASWVLREKGRNRLAMTLLLLLGIPAALFALFFGLLIVANPSWN